ncbi:MAG: hypothetical protein H0U63_05950 [Burkholderiales bacterium]|nr:hypothetical protein [Burkholderiales bacterium]
MRFLYPGIVLLLAGCATPTEYIRPDTGRPTYSTSDGGVARTIERSLVVDRPLGVVWRQLLSGVVKRSFVIEGVNPNTWTAQLRYTGDPKDYIDCGRVISKVKTAKGERNYDFPAAKAYQQYELQQDNKLYLVDRRMNLEARATVVLAAVNPSATRVNLETHYTVIRDQSVQGGGKPFGVTDKVSFGSADSATFPTNAPTKCQATGRLERDVFEAMRR